LLIVNVQAGLSAERAGLQAGDVVVTIGDKKIAAVVDIHAALRGRRKGDVVTVGYVRNAVRSTTPMKLAESPVETSADFDIIYDAVAAGPSVRRTVITRPRGSGRYPAVLFIGGIGCYPVDSPLNDADGYKQLVYSLTRQGFVTMRVEKSGIGDSTGMPCAEVNLDTEVEGYAAGLNALKKLAYADAARTFVVGHSIGGISGPLAAAKEPVRGLFVFATTGITWLEYELINTRRQLKLGGASPVEVNAQLALKAWCTHRLLIERTPRAEILKAKPACADLITYPTSDAYMQQVAAVNLAQMWADLKGVDAVVMHGGADFVVSADDAKAALEAANAVRPGAATYIEMPDLDHFLLQAPSQAASFQRLQTGAAPKLHSDLGKIVGDWLKARAKMTPA
jgi:hypothetical protein